MAKLKSATCNKLPGSAFGIPGQRKYPMEDRVHQIKAKGRATEMERFILFPDQHAKQNTLREKMLPSPVCHSYE
jgi:hypothetical protein